MWYYSPTIDPLFAFGPLQKAINQKVTRNKTHMIVGYLHFSLLLCYIGSIIGNWHYVINGKYYKDNWQYAVFVIYKKNISLNNIDITLSCHAAN